MVTNCCTAKKRSEKLPGFACLASPSSTCPQRTQRLCSFLLGASGIEPLWPYKSAELGHWTDSRAGTVAVKSLLSATLVVC
ncbi:Protein of unknown function [Pyronema omphalodes CBS 100304]|uniref:Uncharacterized protein n=1 Tax=Pyronema omphalodes (strain CBS 100304) TaxID=1076935 RepID=U4LAD5_PYROM|nr:Protein of unknown function [Pyronema omphalodes CBS 100304]